MSYAMNTSCLREFSERKPTSRRYQLDSPVAWALPELLETLSSNKGSSWGTLLCKAFQQDQLGAR